VEHTEVGSKESDADGGKIERRLVLLLELDEGRTRR